METVARRLLHHASEGRRTVKQQLEALDDASIGGLDRFLEECVIAEGSTSTPTTAAVGGPLPSSSSSTSASSHQHHPLPKASDLLRLLLCSKRTAFLAIHTCIQLIRKERLSGRQAVYCISEIRQALATELSITGYSNRSANAAAAEGLHSPPPGIRIREKRQRESPTTTSKTHHSADQSSSVKESLRMLEGMRKILLAIIDLMANLSSNSSSDSSCAAAMRIRGGDSLKKRMNDLHVVIDLVWPLLVMSQRLEDDLRLRLAKARRQGSSASKRKKGGSTPPIASSRGTTSPEEEDLSTLASWQSSEHSIGEEITEGLLAVDWPIPLTLPLLNLCSDLNEFMEGASSAAWKRIRAKIRLNAEGLFSVNGCQSTISTSAAAQKMLSSDGPGLMRQCLLFAEARGGDVTWVHLLRHLYHLIPAEAAATTELVLEQCIKQSLPCVDLILQDLDARLMLRPVSGTTRSSRREGEEDEDDQGPALCWRDLALVLLLQRTVATWPLSSMLTLGGSKNKGGSSGFNDGFQLQIDRLLLSLFLDLASSSSMGAGSSNSSTTSHLGGPSAAAATASSSSAAAEKETALWNPLSKVGSRRPSPSSPGSDTISPFSQKRSLPTSISSSSSKNRSQLGLSGIEGSEERHIPSVVLVGRIRGLLWQVLTQDGVTGSQHHLGRLSIQRGMQLFSIAMSWMEHAEILCQALGKRNKNSSSSKGSSKSSRGGKDKAIGNGFSGSFYTSLRPDDLRQLAICAISTVYGEVPQGQARVLSSLLGAIVEHSQQVQQGPTSSGGSISRPSSNSRSSPGGVSSTLSINDAIMDGGGGGGVGSLKRVGLALVQALEAITTEWPTTLRQHTQVFQQLVHQLPTLPTTLACAVVEAAAPLACSCPAFLDAILALVRKCIVQVNVTGRIFGITALTALLGQNSGLLSLVDRCEEVAAMFESLLTLSLPLSLKSRLYRSVAQAVGGSSNLSRSSAAVPMLRESMGKRLGRFLGPGGRVGEEGLSPLSLFEEYRVKATIKATPRDDLPELLRCVLALVGGGRGYALALHVARMVSSTTQGNSHSSTSPMSTNKTAGNSHSSSTSPTMLLLTNEGDISSGSSSHMYLATRAIDAVIDFIRAGCPMERSERQQQQQQREEYHMMDDDEQEEEGAGRSSSLLPPCNPDSVTAAEKFHLLIPLVEVLIDCLLNPSAAAAAATEEGSSSPTVIGGGPQQQQSSRYHHAMVYEACLQLYQVHGMLSDVAEVLGIKGRDQRPSLEGKERDMPVLGLTGPVYLLQLLLLSCRDQASAAAEENGGKEKDDANACRRCREAKRRYSAWAVQHAVVSCQRALEVERADYRHFGASTLDTEEAAHTRAVSLKTLLIILMDVYTVCPRAFVIRTKEKEDDEEQEQEGESLAKCSSCEQLRQAAEIKAQARDSVGGRSSSSATAAAVRASSSSASSKRPNIRSRSSSHRWHHSLLNTIPLPTAFLANIDGKFRSLVDERLLELQESEEPLMEVRAAIMDLVRVVVRLCPIDSVEADEIFAFIAPPSVASESAAAKATQKKRRTSPILMNPPGEEEEEGEDGSSPSMSKAAAATTSSSSTASLGLHYNGIPSFINHLMIELNQGLQQGLPLRLVQSYLDLFEMLLSRLPPPQHNPTLYYTWRAQVAHQLVTMLIKTIISQSQIIRRFLRLAMQVCPASQAVRLTGGILQAGLRYFRTWLREEQSGGEVVTSSMVREMLEEEGDDELFPDGRDGEEEEEEESGDDEEEEGHAKRRKQQQEEEQQQEEDLVGVDSSAMMFASVPCWQAAMMVILTSWEQFLATVSTTNGSSDTTTGSNNSSSLQQSEAADEEEEREEDSKTKDDTLDPYSYTIIIIHLTSFFQGIDIERNGRTSKQRIAATFLPGPLKLRLLSVISKIIGACRSAIGKIAKHVKVLAKAEMVAQDGGKRKKRDEDQEAAAVSSGSISSGSQDVYLLLAFVQNGQHLVRQVTAWIQSERQRPKQEGGLLKRFPTILYALERLEVALQKLMQQASNDALQLGPGWLDGEEEDEEEEDDCSSSSSEEEEEDDDKSSSSEEEGDEDEEEGERRRGKRSYSSRAAAAVSLVRKKASSSSAAAAAAPFTKKKKLGLPVNSAKPPIRNKTSSSAAAVPPTREKAGLSKLLEALLEERDNWFGSSDGSAGNKKEEDEDEEEDDEAVLLNSMGKHQSSRKRKRRLRSRNTVVDKWLADEDGSDAYADLEDFIMEDEYT